MTNLIAAVVISFFTNIVETDNHQGCQICALRAQNSWALVHTCDIKGPFVPATRKSITTSVYEKSVFTITNATGDHWDFEESRLLYRRTRLYARSEAWTLIGDAPLVLTNNPAITWKTNRMDRAPAEILIEK